MQAVEIGMLSRMSAQDDSALAYTASRTGLLHVTGECQRTAVGAHIAMQSRFRRRGSQAVGLHEDERSIATTPSEGMRLLVFITVCILVVVSCTQGMQVCMDVSELPARRKASLRNQPDSQASAGRRGL